MSDERSRWDIVADEMSERLGGRRVEFGRHVSYWFENSPRRALYSMSYYKFAAKLIGGAKRVLDVGCGEGLGTWLLAKECGYARGVDLDEDAIGVARRNWDDERIDFDCVDFLGEDPETWDAITNFDVIEHILPEHAPAFVSRIAAGLAHDGIAVVGTPSLEGQRHASEIARTGHVNVYDGERLEAEMRRHFGHVFMFAANDEVVHTGFLPMAHYLLAVGCRPRAGTAG